MFNRVLTAEEVDHIYRETRPAVKPEIFADKDLVIDKIVTPHTEFNGRKITLQEWPQLSIDAQRQLLLQLKEYSVDELQMISAELLPILSQAINEWPISRMATGLLLKFDNEQAKTILQEQALPLFYTKNAG